MYRSGQGVPHDNKEAAAWFRLAAEQGNADAQRALGIMYQHGQGVPQDYKEAMQFYRSAAAQGDVNAMLYLGGLYEGRGGDLLRDVLVTADKNVRFQQNLKEAVHWYRLAAEHGDERGQVRLGNMYEEGSGVPKDYEVALRLYRLAAAQGDAEAIIMLDDIEPELIAALTDPDSRVRESASRALAQIKASEIH
jgi:hypothetical protein